MNWTEELQLILQLHDTAPLSSRSRWPFIMVVSGRVQVKLLIKNSIWHIGKESFGEAKDAFIRGEVRVEWDAVNKFVSCVADNCWKFRKPALSH